MAGKTVFVLLLISTVAFAQTSDYCSITCQTGTHIACNAQKCTLGSNCNGKSAELYDYTQSDIDLWLKIDNERRNQIASGSVTGFESASKMLRTTWNNELAAVAAYNVQRCVSSDDTCRATSQYPSAGENVGSQYTFPNTLSAQEVIQMVHDAWFNEYQSANMDQINSFPNPQPEKPNEIGHFTQVVRDLSGQFGCSAVKFVEDGNKNTWNVVCAYSRENTQNDPVYTTGAACSACPNGCDTEYTSLCAPTVASDSATTICGSGNSTDATSGSNSTNANSTNTSGSGSGSSSSGISGSGQSSQCHKRKCRKSKKSQNQRTIKTKQGTIIITESKVKRSQNNKSKGRSGGQKTFKVRKSFH